MCFLWEILGPGFRVLRVNGDSYKYTIAISVKTFSMVKYEYTSNFMITGETVAEFCAFKQTYKFTNQRYIYIYIYKGDFN